MANDEAGEPDPGMAGTVMSIAGTVDSRARRTDEDTRRPSACD